MSFLRQFLAPFLIFLTFLFALVVVSSRAFLPSDMFEPAPIGLISDALSVVLSLTASS